MPFYVHGHDRPDALDGLLRLAEDHWSYMDRFADRLLLRGPTLSDDGEEHTGSVHVVDLADREQAERFAAEEPYGRAGLYTRVTVDPVEVLIDRGPIRDPEAPHSLVTGAWSAAPWSAAVGRLPLADDRVAFAAALVDGDPAHTTGIIAAVRAYPEEAVALVRPLADHLAGGGADITAQRWRRGGRPS
ncbi:YciI family protein [Nocardiopsis sp. RSe5-2]|uniref:YciI family protein n=1 Tax=Nocardiopsis endophytica TaxID=3018445 RepID=A0ABT4UBY2_9ACTN|nr:YciI family protein [Nocardiopsis endophytica]MDA2814471.1 YciI family protein [Nocardiopsis endophytica]